MTEERAVLAGGCFWGMQDLIRRYDGVVSTRVGYTGGDVPNATYRNHGTHAEAIEIIFDPARISYRRFWSSFSRSTIRARAIVRAMTSERATDQRSSTRAMSRSGSPKTRSPMSRLPDCGQARLSPRSFRQATSGKPSPSIRTILNDIPPATPAILSDRTGGCRCEKTLLQSKRDNLPSRNMIMVTRGLTCSLHT